MPETKQIQSEDPKPATIAGSSDRYRIRHRRPPWWLYLPAIIAGLFVLIPMTLVGIQALKSDDIGQALREIFSSYHLKLIRNTIYLTFAVLTTTLLIAWPAAWLSTRPWLKCRHLWSILLVLPLAIPGYVMAYSLRGMGGYGGFLHTVLELSEPVQRLQGFTGAWLALSLYNYPYLFLNLRAALMDFEAAGHDQLEAARSIGHGRLSRFINIILPHTRPALWSGGLIITLHVLGDFGVVALMRYPTMTYELYLHSNMTDIVTASRMVLLLTSFAALFVIAEMLSVRKISLSGSGKGQARAKHIEPGHVPAYKHWLSHGYLAIIISIAVLLPVTIILFWLRKMGLDQFKYELPKLLKALKFAGIFGLGTALFATCLAIPIAALRPRYPSYLAAILEKIPFLGYAMPALAFALSLVFVFLKTPLYNTIFLLILALSFHFLAEAIGPIRAGFFRFSTRMEEASRSLGRSRIATFIFVTLPALRQGLAAAVILTLLSTVKELPITLMLCPPGTTTLSYEIWSHTDNAAFDTAAPYALCMILLCGSLTALVLKYVKRI